MTVDWDEDERRTQFFNSFITQHIGSKEFSSLQSLIFDSCHSGRPGNPPSTMNTPMLSNLTFHAEIFTIPRLSPENIVNLDYTCLFMTPPEVLDLLSAFPALEQCSITDTEPEGYAEDRVDHAVVSLNHLRSLSIKSRWFEDVDYLLDHMDIPATATTIIGLLGVGDDEDDATFESLIGSRLRLYDGLKLVQSPHSLVATLTPKFGGSLQFSYEGDLWRTLKDMSLSSFSAYSSILSSIDLEIPSLSSAVELVEALRPSPLIHIRVRTQEASFERLLTALEDTPGVVCPFLESIDCTGTPFSAARMRNFLNFREAKAIPLRELKITKGLCDPDTHGFLSIVDRLIEVDARS
ncbi:hypothetical protein SISNIDRAFT_487103 [Sistotremastrum niveocremeum HHB9708]|uniref:F-box domain-containing protein n=1 Tax=Sistotremastrum niveocremeum HHB9708 TaxID=1314777 RepID=A0A164ST90_9AGAM|nr:hypothetical protein SISNIDRAFT_487103 [Sistotremastrum niveocremeum HHB9708]